MGNGGIEDYESFLFRQKISNASGYMIGRAAVQKPWIFREIQDRRTESAHPLLEVNLEETAMDFFQLLPEYQPQDFLLTRARRFSLYYHKNLKFGYKFHFSRIQNAESLEEIMDYYRDYFKIHPHERVKTISSLTPP